MGGCCSREERFEGSQVMEEMEEEEEHEDDIIEPREGYGGALVRLHGSCMVASMYTQQGKKGINQDAMTVWEDFNGEKGAIFCGVFDGHGPLGHRVAGHVRDVLPSKLSYELRCSKPHEEDFKGRVGHERELCSDQDENDHNNINCSHDDDDELDIHGDAINDDGCHPSLHSWKGSFVKAFKDMDEELYDSTIDCFCSGATAVSILKQGEYLKIANLGDSRAILCTRDNKNQPIPIQLTVDLKPNVPSEAERIKRCKGRIFSMEEEPRVYRVWLPDEDCPGLAMARAFGDFCLKGYGVISVPQVSYRKITDKDEFVVLATDGVWDVLSNKEVVRIVASAKKQSTATKRLVGYAVRAWKSKYPLSKTDDCAAICLFLKFTSSSLKPTSDVAESDRQKCSQPSFSESLSTGKSDQRSQRAEVSTADQSKEEEWTAFRDVSRVIEHPIAAS